MKKYLITIKPLEPYSFGTEQGYQFPGESGMGKISYLAKSGCVPSQTTVLGLIRYLVLSSKEWFKSDIRDYSEDEIEKNKEAVGKDTFSFGWTGEKPQEFGVIKSVSPVFITKGEEIFIRNPFNNKASNEGFCPYKLTEDTYETSDGSIQMPLSGEYDAKKGHAEGYIGLDSKRIVRDLFSVILQSGNRKNNTNDDKDGYFKREYVRMKDGYAFAVIAELEDELLTRSFGYMGSKKSAFEITCKETSIYLEKAVEDAFSDSRQECFYALSDIFPDETPTYSGFCIVGEKYQRNLETDYSAGRYRKSRVRVNLIESGSVFYFDVSKNLKVNENAGRIGYNYIVKLGGK